MVAGDLRSSSAPTDIVGDVAALASAAGFAFYAAIVRSAPERDWSPVLPGYGVLMIVICSIVTFADGDTFVPPAPDIALALVHGAVFIVGGTLIFNSASRSIPAAADDRVRPDRDGARARLGVPAAVGAADERAR